MDAPAPGTTTTCELIGKDTDTRCEVTGIEGSVRFEYSRTPSFGPRRVHLVVELERTDLRMGSELGRLVPVDA